MVSRMAKVATTDPPGDSISSRPGAFGSSICQNKSIAMHLLALSSSIGPSIWKVRISLGGGRNKLRRDVDAHLVAPLPDAVVADAVDAAIGPFGRGGGDEGVGIVRRRIHG